MFVVGCCLVGVRCCSLFVVVVRGLLLLGVVCCFCLRLFVVRCGLLLFVPSFLFAVVGWLVACDCMFLFTVCYRVIVVAHCLLCLMFVVCCLCLLYCVVVVCCCCGLLNVVGWLLFVGVVCCLLLVGVWC